MAKAQTEPTPAPTSAPTPAPQPLTPASPPPKPPCLTLTLEQVGQLSAAVGYNIQTPEDLIQRVQNLTKFDLEEVGPVTISPLTLTRLKSRCPSSQPFPPFLANLVIDLLNRHTY